MKRSIAWKYGQFWPNGPRGIEAASFTASSKSARKRLGFSTYVLALATAAENSASSRALSPAAGLFCFGTRAGFFLDATAFVFFVFFFTRRYQSIPDCS